MDFAQITTYPWDKPLLPFGIGVAVIAWLLFRTEPRLRAMEKTIDRLSRSILLLVATYAQSEGIKKHAKEIEKEIDEAEAARNKDKI